MKTLSAARPPKSPSSPHLVLPSSAPRAQREARDSRDSRAPASPNKAATLKRMAALYNELKLRDSKSVYPWRLLTLVFLGFVTFSVLHFVASGLFSILPPVQLGFPTTSLYSRYDEMFYEDSDFAYVPESKLFLTTTAKAGSTTFLSWVHRGVTGRENFGACNYTSVQDFGAPCWEGKVRHPFNLSGAERWRILNSPKVLRVAVTRDPFERLISAWKSKAACDSDDFGTDVVDRDAIVPVLLHQAGLRRDSTCLSLPSFAQVLDMLRLLAEHGDFGLKDVNRNFRPQQCHFADIKYDMVLDVSQLSDMTILAPIVQKMKFPELVSEPPRRLHVSRQAPQTMSEITAAALYKFALLSERLPKPSIHTRSH